jgi:sulfate transport system substrate-binding protein
VTANSAHPAEAKAFVDFVLSPAGQEIFVQSGYRPVIDGVPGADKFPTPSGLFTVDDLGGWSDVSERFFDTSTGLMVEVERNIGVTVE